MSAHEAVATSLEVDPWARQARNRRPLARDVRLAYIQDLPAGARKVVGVVCLPRTPTRDELWGSQVHRWDAGRPGPEILADPETRGQIIWAARARHATVDASRLWAYLVRVRTGVSGRWAGKTGSC